MEKIKLKSKPLVEALFELRYKLRETKVGIKIDPNYKLIIGRLYDKIKKSYNFHEQLPTASLPDEMIEGIVQHRFRKGEGKWPLIQIGPGILSVNDTENYSWNGFEKRIINAVNNFFSIYPDSNKLDVNSIILKYINIIEFDFEKANIFNFLKEKMKINISLYPYLFDKTNVIELPLGFDWKFSFRCTEPKSIISLRFVRGIKRKENKSGLIWETTVHSKNEDLPEIPNNLNVWLKEAHEIIHDWFFKLIEGNLFRRFEK